MTAQSQPHEASILTRLAGTLAPIALACAQLLAIWSGGAWIWAALAMVLVASLWGGTGAFTPAKRIATPLVVAMALVHFVILFSAVFQIAGAHERPVLTNTAFFMAVGLYVGQISNATAHELIHRPQKPLFRLGSLMFVSHLFGHHTSAHRLVHHVHVATRNDPNSAPAGMSVYRFLPRAWIGSFVQGLRREKGLRNARAWATPYTFYVVGGLAFMGAVYALTGLRGLAIYVGLTSYATMQLLVTDYVQHYGLRRARGPGGAPVAVGPGHSWDAPGTWAARVMFNATRHAAHHVRPADTYDQLSSQGAPMLPHSLAVMGFIAFVPRWWFAKMKTPLESASRQSAA